MSDPNVSTPPAHLSEAVEFLRAGKGRNERWFLSKREAGWAVRPYFRREPYGGLFSDADLIEYAMKHGYQPPVETPVSGHSKGSEKP